MEEVINWLELAKDYFTQCKYKQANVAVLISIAESLASNDKLPLKPPTIEELKQRRIA
jgi:hypothetical protein